MFFKVLIIVIGVYLLSKWIIRGVVSYFLDDATDNLNEKLRRQQQELSKQKKKQEGRVTINYQPKEKKNIRKEEGDYVDFEEV